jgi:hypothetical protein
VAYYLKANKRAAFTVRLFDKAEKASIEESDAGAFEGALPQKSDFH